MKQDMTLPENNLRVKEAESGDWKIEKFEIVEDMSMTIFNMRSAGRSVVPGWYWKLKHGSTVVMSNTPAEIRDHRVFICKAQGNVLINGLGLGVINEILLAKPEVEHITVVEASEDVIKLTGVHYENEPRVTIVHDDAFEYKPPKGVRYNAVWNDIWNDICSDNLEDMKRLHRKYGRKADWIGSWCRYECERQWRENQKWERQWNMFRPSPKLEEAAKKLQEDSNGIKL